MTQRSFGKKFVFNFVRWRSQNTDAVDKNNLCDQLLCHQCDVVFTPRDVITAGYYFGNVLNKPIEHANSPVWRIGKRRREMGYRIGEVMQDIISL